MGWRAPEAGAGRVEVGVGLDRVGWGADREHLQDAIYKYVRFRYTLNTHTHTGETIRKCYTVCFFSTWLAALHDADTAPASCSRAMKTRSSASSSSTCTRVKRLRKERGRPLRPPPSWRGFWAAKRRKVG